MANKNFHSILSEFEYKALKSLSKKLNVSKSEVVRKGIRGLAEQHNIKIPPSEKGKEQLELKL